MRLSAESTAVGRTGPRGQDRTSGPRKISLLTRHFRFLLSESRFHCFAFFLEYFSVVFNRLSHLNDLYTKTMRQKANALFEFNCCKEIRTYRREFFFVRKFSLKF